MSIEAEYKVKVEDVEYQRLDGKPMLARVYQPEGPGPFPTIVDMHGGAWRTGDRTNNTTTDQALAARRVLVAALDFRQSTEATYPASVADLNLGIRWMKSRAADFNGSASVGSFGVSSGGHLVTLAGVRPRDPRYTTLPLPGHPEIDARCSYVVAAWPVIDPLYRFRFAQQAGREELVSSHLKYWETEAAMEEGAPRTAIERGEDVDLPPILMMLKEDDPNHPLAMQEAFVEAYRKRGGSIEVQSFVGLPDRGMDPIKDGPEAVRAIEVMVDFIRRQTGR